jgi:hypothetical protein
MTSEETALAVRTQATELASLTDELAYTTAEEREFANGALREIKDMAAEIEEREKEITRPLREGIEKVRALFAPAKAALAAAESEVKAGILAGLQAEESTVQREAQAAADRGDAKAAIALIAEAPTAPEGFEIRRLARAEVTNAANVPPKFLSDPRVIKAIEQVTLPELRKGVTIPGVRLVYKTSVATKG